MIRCYLALGLCPIAAVLLSQCGNNEPGPALVGMNQKQTGEAHALFAEAKAEEEKGDFDDAIDLYEDLADDFPLSLHAGDARYRQAMLLDRKMNDRRDAFEAYEKFLSHFPSHSKYDEAIRRVYEIAIGAKRGDIQTNFLGIKGNLPFKETLEMLDAVKRHAPKSDLAAKSQYAIGELYLREKKYKGSVAAFSKVADDHHNHPLAPEALFRVGTTLQNMAERGNQNKATIDLSREAFNDYLIQFPGHKRNAEARKMIASLDASEVIRAAEIADFYYKTEQWESAKIYYREVIKKTKSGPEHDRAKARLKELND